MLAFIHGVSEKVEQFQKIFKKKLQEVWILRGIINSLSLYLLDIWSVWILENWLSHLFDLYKQKFALFIIAEPFVTINFSL